MNKKDSSIAYEKSSSYKKMSNLETKTKHSNSNNIRKYKDSLNLPLQKTVPPKKIFAHDSDKIINSFILIAIYLFIILEEADWLVFSAKDKENAQCEDNSLWNIENILNK